MYSPLVIRKTKQIENQEEFIGEKAKKKSLFPERSYAPRKIGIKAIDVWNTFIKPEIVFNGKIVNNKIKQIVRNGHENRMLGAPTV